MSLIDSLYPQTLVKVRKFLDACHAVGLDVRVYSGYRSFAEQARLYQAYQDGTGPRAAPPGSSFHNVRRAVDFLCYRGGLPIERGDDPDYGKAGEIAEKCGLAWGGRWNHPDFDHVEDEECVTCGIEVGPKGASHFDETGEHA